MKKYRHTNVARFYNAAISRLLWMGVPIGPMVLLTVPGRKTSLPRTTPVALARHETGWQLVAAYGVVDWVKNLQAADSAVVTSRRCQVPVTSRQLPDDQAAPILRDSMASAGMMTRLAVGPYFDADPKAPLEAWREEAIHHPVFVLTPASD